MSAPSSTYRIQLHKGFPLRDLQRVVDYLHTLGIDTIYASPITQATPESMHGYDVTDPHSINQELGDIDDLKTIVKELRKRNMQWLQDIVPNHMAFHVQNSRLMDVLERGPASPYYRYFDIDWNHPDPDLTGKVMVPFLGDEIETCVSEGQIKLSLGEDGLKVKYFDTAYPLSLPAYARLSGMLDEKDLFRTVLTRMTSTDASVPLETWTSTKRALMQGAMDTNEGQESVEYVLNAVNNDRQRLLDLLEVQHYRMCFWKETDRRINYRRFFTVNELICLRMEDKAVFDEYHELLLKLHKEDLVQGFRIDHIDGLQDPAGYTQELRANTGESTYIIAEKILEAKEDMPAKWPLHGTSGYEFLSLLNQLLTYRKGARELLDFYRHLVPDIPEYSKLIFNSKKLILENYMRGEWDNITRLFSSSGLAHGYDHDRVRSAIGLFMLSLPVYRIYPDSLPLKGKSLATIHEAFDKAVRQDPEFSSELTYLRGLFTGVPTTDREHELVLNFLKRLMQFTGPLTAKGVEDTTFYIYNPLISHDEVGDSPVPLGMKIQRFHEKMQNRQASTPLSLNATATHDTKRGEDARVRISVLSRIPDLWKEKVQHWIGINSKFRDQKNGRTVPEINDEYFIYQSMLGGFPEDFAVTDEWKERVKAYLNKALREAKVNTNWSDPDEIYEKGCEQFIDRIVDPGHTFLESFVPFVRTVCEHAMVYSLSQTLIKLTAPGLPDIYQGCELWDLSFVDPDNRRPVDYEKRMQFLFQLVVRDEQGPGAVFEYLRENRLQGIEKLFVIWKTLNFRKKRSSLFSNGTYLPVAITGEETRAAAYARTDGSSWIIAVFPFGLVRHEMDDTDLTEQFLVLPEEAPRRWYNLFTGRSVDVLNQMALAEVFRDFPVALMVDEGTVGGTWTSR